MVYPVVYYARGMPVFENLQLVLILVVAVAIVLAVLGLLLQWAIIRGAVLSALRQHARESRPRRATAPDTSTTLLDAQAAPAHSSYQEQ